MRREAKTRVTAARLRADKAFEGEEWEECEAALGDALRLDTQNPGLYLSRAYVRLKQDRTTRSLQDSSKAISLNPRSPRGYHRYARSLCQEKRFSAVWKTPPIKVREIALQLALPVPDQA